MLLAPVLYGLSLVSSPSLDGCHSELACPGPLSVNMHCVALPSVSLHSLEPTLTLLVELPMSSSVFPKCPVAFLRAERSSSDLTTPTSTDGPCLTSAAMLPFDPPLELPKHLPAFTRRPIASLGVERYTLFTQTPSSGVSWSLGRVILALLIVSSHLPGAFRVSCLFHSTRDPVAPCFSGAAFSFRTPCCSSSLVLPPLVGGWTE